MFVLLFFEIKKKNAGFYRSNGLRPSTSLGDISCPPNTSPPPTSSYANSINYPTALIPTASFATSSPFRSPQVPSRFNSPSVPPPGPAEDVDLFFSNLSHLIFDKLLVFCFV